MKVAPLTEALNFINIVREKPDGQSSRDRENQGERKEQSQEFAEELRQKVDAQTVGEAISEFSKDEQARLNGISAETSGKGPGLKVVLKDGNGAVIRQFTGEEFLRLREAASKDHRARGKILDQKL